MVKIQPEEGDLSCFCVFWMQKNTRQSHGSVTKWCLYRPKQTTPNSGSLLSTPKGITRPAYPTYTSTMALPNLLVPSTTKNCM